MTSLRGRRAQERWAKRLDRKKRLRDEANRMTKMTLEDEFDYASEYVRSGTTVPYGEWRPESLEETSAMPKIPSPTKYNNSRVKTQKERLNIEAAPFVEKILSAMDSRPDPIVNWTPFPVVVPKHLVGSVSELFWAEGWDFNATDSDCSIRPARRDYDEMEGNRG